MKPHKIDILLLNILNGTATDKEVLLFSEWMTDDANSLYFQNMKEVWHLSEEISMATPINEGGREQFMNRIKKENYSKRLRRTVFASSTVAAILIASFLFFYDTPKDEIIVVAEVGPIKTEQINNDITFITSTSEGDTLKVVKLEESNNTLLANKIAEIDSLGIDKHTNVVIMNTIIVPKGKRLSTTLPDSSKIWINSDSRVSFPRTFAHNNRTVEVIGNAYFEVVEDKSRPFEVITGGIRTTALGTQFEVNNYDSLRCFITLVEGRVSVESNHQKVVINPNTQIESRFGVENFIQSTSDARLYGLWRDNILSINNEPITSIIEKLSRWHNIEIINRTNGVENIYFTGKLDNGTIEEHLTIISGNIKLKFAKEGERMIIWN